jgi:hypothetical protein
MLVKVILAVGVGAGALAGAKFLWLSSIKQQVLSQTASAAKPMVTSPKLEYFDRRKFHDTLYTKIDVAGFAQRGATSAANRQIDLAIRAGNSVPRQPSFTGMRR